MSVVVIATIKPLSQYRQEVIEALKLLVATAHTESGVERFALLENEDVFVIIERWADKASMEAHIATPLSPELLDIVATKLHEEPEHLYLTPVAAGDRTLGQP